MLRKHWDGVASRIGWYNHDESTRASECLSRVQERSSSANLNFRLGVTRDAQHPRSVYSLPTREIAPSSTVLTATRPHLNTYFLTSSFLHGLTRTANPETIRVLVLGPAWRASQSQKKVGTRYLTYEQRSDTMRGNTKAVSRTRSFKCLEGVSWPPSSGRLMSVCCRVVLRDKILAIPCRSSDISSPLRPSVTRSYVIINGLQLVLRAAVTLS